MIRQRLVHCQEKKTSSPHIGYFKTHTHFLLHLLLYNQQCHFLLCANAHHAHFNPSEPRLHEDTQTTAIVTHFCQKIIKKYSCPFYQRPILTPLILSKRH